MLNFQIRNSMGDFVRETGFSEIALADLRAITKEFLINLKYPRIKILPDKYKSSVPYDAIRILSQPTIDNLILNIKDFIQFTDDNRPTLYIIGICQNKKGLYQINLWVDNLNNP